MVFHTNDIILQKAPYLLHSKFNYQITWSEDARYEQCRAPTRGLSMILGPFEGCSPRVVENHGKPEDKCSASHCREDQSFVAKNE